MKVDHIGYAVKDIGKAKKSMEALGWTFQGIVEDTERSIYIAFGRMENYRVELVAPMHAGGG